MSDLQAVRGGEWLFVLPLGRGVADQKGCPFKAGTGRGRHAMWWVAGLVVVLGLGWGYLRLARTTRAFSQERTEREARTYRLLRL